MKCCSLGLHIHNANNPTVIHPCTSARPKANIQFTLGSSIASGEYKKPVCTASCPNLLQFALKPPAATSATSSSEASPPSGTSTTTSTPSTTSIRDLLPSFVLWLWRIIDQKGIQRQGIGEDVVSNGRSTEIDCIEGYWVSATLGHLDCAQRCIHLRRN